MNMVYEFENYWKIGAMMIRDFSIYVNEGTFSIVLFASNNLK